MRKMTEMKIQVPDGFTLCKFSQLKVDIEIMRFEPFKSILLPAIKDGKLKDLFYPVVLPSLSKKGDVQYSQEAVNTVSGKTWFWWYHQAKSYMPERNSHLADRVEYLAFIYSLLVDLKSGNENKGFSSLGSKYYILAYDNDINGFWSAGATSISDALMTSMVSFNEHHRLERVRETGVGLIVLS